MNEPLKITVNLAVSLNDYLKPRGIKSGNRIMGMLYESSEAKAYKKYFKQELERAVKQSTWITEHDHNHFYIIESVIYFDKQNRDSNNMWKIMIDAITETQLIWLDDRQAMEQCRRIYYDTKNPRMEITIRESEFIGIFDNMDHYEQFIYKNCLGCSRYTNNCSLLKSSIESRITEEISIEDMSCSSRKVKKEKPVKVKKEKVAKAKSLSE